MKIFGACKGGWSSVIFFIFVIHVLQGKYGHKQNRKLSPQSAESSSYQLMAQLLSYTHEALGWQISHMTCYLSCFVTNFKSNAFFSHCVFINVLTFVTVACILLNALPFLSQTQASIWHICLVLSTYVCKKARMSQNIFDYYVADGNQVKRIVHFFVFALGHSLLKVAEGRRVETWKKYQGNCCIYELLNHPKIKKSEDNHSWFLSSLSCVCCH